MKLYGGHPADTEVEKDRPRRGDTHVLYLSLHIQPGQRTGVCLAGGPARDCIVNALLQYLHTIPMGDRDLSEDISQPKKTGLGMLMKGTKDACTTPDN